MIDHTDLLARLEYLSAKPKYMHSEADTAMTDAAAAIREQDAQLEALRILAREQVRGMTELQAQLEAANSTIATQRTEYEQINDAAITLQAQLDAARKVADGAAEAQRTLFEQLEAERKAREEADKQRRANSDRAAKWERRAEAAESRLATVEADTIERCARLFEGLTFGRYLHPSITIRALNKETPATAAVTGSISGIVQTPTPAADTAVSWGHPRQNYPGGPIYRVGTSTGMVIDPADTGGKT